MQSRINLGIRFVNARPRAQSCISERFSADHLGYEILQLAAPLIEVKADAHAAQNRQVEDQVVDATPTIAATRMVSPGRAIETAAADQIIFPSTPAKRGMAGPLGR